MQGEPTQTPEPQTPEPTDNLDVDEVVRAVQELEGRPVEDHVSVFERAHEQLRRALDTA